MKKTTPAAAPAWHGNLKPAELGRVLRPKAAADFLSVSRTTLWRLAREGRIAPPLQIGARARGWTMADLLAAQAAMQSGGPSKGGTA